MKRSADITITASGCTSLMIRGRNVNDLSHILITSENKSASEGTMLVAVESLKTNSFFLTGAAGLQKMSLGRLGDLKSSRNFW